MKTRTLGPKGPAVSAVGLGCMSRAHMSGAADENGGLDACRRLGAGFAPYSPLGRGFLSGEIEAAFRADRWSGPRCTEAIMAAVNG